MVLMIWDCLLIEIIKVYGVNYERAVGTKKKKRKNERAKKGAGDMV